MIYSPQVSGAVAQVRVRGHACDKRPFYYSTCVIMVDGWMDGWGERDKMSCPCSRAMITDGRCVSARCVLGVGGRGEQGARKESEGGVSCGVTFLCGVFFDGDNNVFSFGSGRWLVRVCW